MTPRQPTTDPAKRRGIRWTAILLGLLALGFYIAFILVTGASNQ